MDPFFYQLAPLRLLNYRTFRYKGETRAVRLSVLGAADQERLVALYQFLQNFLIRLSALEVLEERHSEHITLQDVVQGMPIPQLREHLLRLGSDTQVPPGDELELSLHDARGGSISALVSLLSWLTGDDHPALQPHLRSLFYYTRDQLKVLRNAFLELDDRHRENDLLFKTHDIRTVVRKLEVASRFRNEQPASLHLAGEFDGDIAACCCESAALDRVLHNCLDNAYRHAADNVVHFRYFPVPDAPGPDLRLVVSSALTPEDGTALQARAKAPGGLHTLFERGVSSSRTGLGLTVVANFIVDAYGLRTTQEALEGGYLGVCCREGVFHVWFHWPIVR